MAKLSAFFHNLRGRIKKRKKLSLAIGAGLLALLLYLLFSSGSSAKTEILASAKVERGGVTKTLSATGIVKSEVGATVKIGTRATGVIRKMHVRVGDTVTAGQIIAQIDSRELEAVVAEAEAALSRAKAEHDRTLVTYPLQIAEAKARVESALATLEYAELSYKRQLELTGRKLDSQNNLDLALEKSLTDKQTLAVARATLRRLQEEFERQKEITRQAVIQAEASLETAKIKLSYTTIISPMDGIVSQVASQEGETVVSGLQVANLITVTDLSRKEMWVYIDENDVGQVKPGMRVDFRVDALPGRSFSGEVYRIYPEAEVRDSIVYYQTIVPLNKEDSLALRAEMTTQCTVYVDEKDGVLKIPNEAIKWIDGGQVVFVERGKNVEPVRVVLGMQGRDYSEVLEGLAEGDVVATRLTLGSDITGKLAKSQAALTGHPGGAGGGPRR